MCQLLAAMLASHGPFCGLGGLGFAVDVSMAVASMARVAPGIDLGGVTPIDT
jgi:hypothetical protein